MSEKINNIYRSILMFSGMKADDQGYVSNNLNGKLEPAIVNSLRLVLPTDHNLRNFNPSEKMVFHPLTENILRGESDVIGKLKKSINIKLNFTIGVIAQSLLNLIASPEQHGNLNSEQSEILTIVSNADEKSVTDFISQMVSGIRNDPERLFVNIYLKRGGTVNGKRYSRAGIVTFPFYEKLKNDEVTKIRVKDKEPFKQLFQFMFPNLDNVEEYNFGSESNVAPYLEALMMTSAQIASRLNDLCITYNKYIDQAESLMFDSDWLEDFKDLPALAPEIRKIPVQHGNEGSIGTDDPVRSNNIPTVQNNPVMVPQQYPQQQPMMQPQAPGLRTTKRGLDFKSVMQNNQALQMSGNMLAPALQQQQMQQFMLQQQQQMMQQQAQNASTFPGTVSYPQPGMMPPQMMPQQYPQVQPGYAMMPNGQVVPMQQQMMPQQYPVYR